MMKEAVGTKQWLAMHLMLMNRRYGTYIKVELKQEGH